MDTKLNVTYIIDKCLEHYGGKITKFKESCKEFFGFLGKKPQVQLENFRLFMGLDRNTINAMLDIYSSNVNFNVDVNIDTNIDRGSEGTGGGENEPKEYKDVVRALKRCDELFQRGDADAFVKATEFYFGDAKPTSKKVFWLEIFAEIKNLDKGDDLLRSMLEVVESREGTVAMERTLGWIRKSLDEKVVATIDQLRVVLSSSNRRWTLHEVDSIHGDLSFTAKSPFIEGSKNSFVGIGGDLKEKKVYISREYVKSSIRRSGKEHVYAEFARITKYIKKIDKS